MDNDAILPVTAEDVNKLQSAFLQGVKSVKYADKEAVYRSLDEMKEILAWAKGQVYGNTGECDSGVSFMEFNKGLR